MKIVHRVAFCPNDSQLGEIRSLGISPKIDDSPLTKRLTGVFVWFDIDESHPAWPKLSAMLDEWDVTTFSGARFSEKDRHAAPFLELGAWAHGYPMPDLDFGYLEATYDLADYCEKCGIGNRQIAPFRMKREPKWGKKHIMSLEWVYDELFVQPEAWERTFRPFGIGCRPVLHHKSGSKLQTVVQLDITATAASPLKIPADQPTEFCATCGRTKYQPIQLGPFPGFETEPTEAMLKTREWFGSGAEARRPVIISSRLFRTMREHQIKGAVFWPCAPSGV